MSLRLNLREKDLAIRFGVSVSIVSKYFITKSWVCFLYAHLHEVQWMPDVDQVTATLPHTFKEKYPNTYIILDATESLLKLLMTYMCSHQPGRITSITIPQNFLLVALRMVQLASFQSFM